MKIFRTKSEIADVKNLQETQNTLKTLEKMLEEIRRIIGYRRTLLKNADKKLQEFQDTIYAMIIEEDYPKKKSSGIPENDDEDGTF